MAHQAKMELLVKRDLSVHLVWLVNLASLDLEELQVRMAVQENQELKENQVFLENEGTKATQA